MACREALEAIRAGSLDTLKRPQILAYLRAHKLLLIGLKDELLSRMREFIRLQKHGSKEEPPASSFTISGKANDLLVGDRILFEEDVFESNDGSNGTLLGKRRVAARVVFISVGLTRYTLEVIWSDGVEPFSGLCPYILMSTKLQHLKFLRIPREGEDGTNQKLDSTNQNTQSADTSVAPQSADHVHHLTADATEAPVDAATVKHQSVSISEASENISPLDDGDVPALHDFGDIPYARKRKSRLVGEVKGDHDLVTGSALPLDNGAQEVDGNDSNKDQITAEREAEPLLEEAPKVLEQEGSKNKVVALSEKAGAKKTEEGQMMKERVKAKRKKEKSLNLEPVEISDSPVREKDSLIEGANVESFVEEAPEVSKGNNRKVVVTTDGLTEQARAKKRARKSERSKVKRRKEKEPLNPDLDPVEEAVCSSQIAESPVREKDTVIEEEDAEPLVEGAPEVSKGNKRRVVTTDGLTDQARAKKRARKSERAKVKRRKEKEPLNPDPDPVEEVVCPSQIAESPVREKDSVIEEEDAEALVEGTPEVLEDNNRNALVTTDVLSEEAQVKKREKERMKRKQAKVKRRKEKESLIPDLVEVLCSSWTTEFPVSEDSVFELGNAASTSNKDPQNINMKEEQLRNRLTLLTRKLDSIKRNKVRSGRKVAHIFTVQDPTWKPKQTQLYKSRRGWEQKWNTQIHRKCVCDRNASKKCIAGLCYQCCITRSGKTCQAHGARKVSKGIVVFIK